MKLALTVLEKKYMLNKHQRFVHENEKPYKCKICLTSFREKNKKIKSNSNVICAKKNLATEMF